MARLRSGFSKSTDWSLRAIKQLLMLIKKKQMFGQRFKYLLGKKWKRWKNGEILEIKENIEI